MAQQPPVRRAATKPKETLDDIFGVPQSIPTKTETLDDIFGAPSAAAKPIPASNVPFGVARSAAQGLPFVGTFADEAEALVRRGPYSKNLSKIQNELSQFRSEHPAVAYGTEIGTSILSGGALANLVKKMGTSAIAKALQYGLQSGVIQGAAAGGGAADGGVGNRAVGTVVGGATGGVLNRLLTPTSKVLERDIARDVTGAVAGMGQNTRVASAESIRNRLANTGVAAQRSVSDALAPYAPRMASFVEPMDATKVKRLTQQAFPSALTIDDIERQAQKAGAAAKSIASEQSAAAEAVKQSAQKTSARGKALVDKAEQDAKQLVAKLEERASALLNPLAKETDQGSLMRNAIKAEMKETGERMYPELQRIPPLAKPPMRIYQQIDSDLKLPVALEYALATKQERLMAASAKQAVEAGRPITEKVKVPRLQTYVVGRRADPITGEIKDITRPALDLETFDYMKRWVNDSIEAGLSGDASGITRSEGMQLKDKITRMEEDFLNAHTPEQRTVLKNARAAMSQMFQRLDLVQEGLNLDRLTLNAPAKMREASEKDLAEQIKRIAALDPAERKFFEVPARQAISNILQRSDRSVGSMVKALVGTTESARRTAMVLGEDAVAELRTFLPEAIQRTADQSVSRVKTLGEALVERGVMQEGRRTQKIAKNAEQLGRELSAQSERAGQLSATADAARRLGQAFPETPAGREAAEAVASLNTRALGNEGLNTLREYGSASLRRELEGLSGDDAQRRLQQLLKNPATNKLLGAQIEALLTAVKPAPRVVRPAISRFAGGSLGNLLAGFGGSPSTMNQE